MEVWIGRDGERLGPYKEADIRQWLRSGQVSPDDLGWYEGLADWQPLSVLFPDEKPAVASTAPPLPQRTASTPASASEAAADYAGFWQRFGAWVIDLIVLIVPSIIAFYALGGLDAYKHFLEQIQAGADMATAMREYALSAQSSSVATVVIGFVYYTLFEGSKWQATPGKLALRLRVTDLDGRRLSLGRAAARNAVRLTNIIIWLIPFVCYLAVAWTQRKQGLHDLVASTLVLNGRVGEQPPQRPQADGSHHGSFDA
ncbi:RDD family protein [Dyella subtropica]|uniref:RDD family protein n=1 Tax=Dyella subtropica TaxID=2992127 RepID=UPI002253482D|nr:RDD family protein [Dyella subtropica]